MKKLKVGTSILIKGMSIFVFGHRGEIGTIQGTDTIFVPAAATSVEVYLVSFGKSSVRVPMNDVIPIPKGATEAQIKALLDLV